MCFSPQLDSPEEWEATVTKALENYRSGRALMDQLHYIRFLEGVEGIGDLDLSKFGWPDLDPSKIGVHKTGRIDDISSK